MTYKLDYTSVALGQQLVLAVVNNSDWDTDDHMQSCNGLDKAMTWATNCFMELGNFTAVILSGCPGESHVKRAGMLVVSLRGVKFGFWSLLGLKVYTVDSR